MFTIQKSKMNFGSGLIKSALKVKTRRNKLKLRIYQALNHFLIFM